MKELLENLQGYIQSNIDLAKLEVQEKIEFYTNKVVKYASLIFFILLSSVFLLTFLGFLISSILNSYVYGFGILALILIIISVVIYFNLKQNTNNKAGIS